MRAAAVCSLALWIGSAAAGRGENTAPPLSKPTAAPAPEQAEPADDSSLLTQKLAELRRLQAEIEKLRQSTAGNRRIRIELKHCEVSLTKLQRLGLDLTELGFGPATSGRWTTITGKSAGKNAPPAFVGQADCKAVAGIVEMLRRENILKTLAAPTLITTDGRTAYFLSGSGGPVPSSLGQWVKESSNLEFGNQVHVTATLLGGRRIRLSVLAKATELDPSVTITLNGATIPGLKTHETEAPFEVELGATAVLGGLVLQNTQVAVDPKADQESTVPEASLMLYLITPELLEPAD